MNSPETIAGMTIAAVERDTGLGKDTLRIWERRYGFPRPLRDAGGERVYPPEQVEHLRLVKRLMDQGGRPGTLLREPIDTLADKLANAVTGGNESVDWVIPLLKQRDVDRLRAEFAQRLARDGLERFVTETVPELNRRIGDGWLAGDIEIFEEHLYTELMQNQLRAAIHALGHGGLRPRVLLATIKDEEHQLGLLLVEALLSVNGAACVSLGIQTPIADIAAAARSTGADIVALSFSGACPWRRARDSLIELRAALPPTVEIWAGGAALAGGRRRIDGVQVLIALPAVPSALEAWRSRRNGA